MIDWVRYGPHALLLRFAAGVGPETFDLGRAIAAELRRNPPAGLVECVPGFTTLLLRFEPGQAGNLPWLGRYIADQLASVAPTAAREAPLKELPARYDGEDLEPLAREKNLSVPELIRLHSEPVYRVYLLGFSPGFPYLGELNPLLHTPRRAAPRPKVAAGSVAIGGEHTGVYSVDSPGGWHIIGHTPVRLFEHERVAADGDPESVFFLKPGDRVRFIPIPKAKS
jgi:inhibitor of KinA